MSQTPSIPNPPSDAPSQESYPSRPSKEHPPKRWVNGGYIIDNPTCIAWGSRLDDYPGPLNPEVENDCLRAFCCIMEKVEEKPYNAYFVILDPVMYKEYMIVTQAKRFDGWVGMDPKLMPQFEEGEREAIARELLKEEGITKHEFRTVLYKLY